jgi:hypothetical protein
MEQNKLEKFEDFLNRITNDNNKLIVDKCRDGFNLIYKGDTSNNPYSQDDVIEQSSPYYDVNPSTRRQISDLDEKTQKMVKAIQNKFGVSLNEIHDNYLIFHTDLTLKQYFDYIMSQDKWDSKAYYDNDLDEYYAKIPKKYATPINNRYKDRGHSSGL